MADQSTNHYDAINLDSQEVGAVYGKALLGATESAGRSEQVLEEFGSLLNDVFAAHPKFEQVLASGLVSPEEKMALLDRTLGGRASPLFLNFLKVLARHGRLEHLRSIRLVASRMLDQLRGRIQVEVKTATPLASELSQTIADQLRGMLGGEPYLVERVDPELIGGIVLRAGDTVFDGSVSTHLKNIREQMIDRSVHEIQRRRDRFSPAAGN